MNETPSASRPLSVLHLIPGSAAGGVTRYVFDLCFAMKAMGHEVAVAGQAGAWHWLFESAEFSWIETKFRPGLFGSMTCTAR